MVRSYAADLTVEKFLNNLAFAADRSSPCIGLLVGVITPHRDFIIHAMKTPIVEDKGKTATNSNEGSTKKPTSPAELSESVIERSLCIHARQVRQMLTGGLEILGMFVHSFRGDMKSLESKYKQIFYRMYKIVNKFDFLLPKFDRTSERILLFRCYWNRSTVCKSFDISDPKDTGHPAELQFMRLGNAFASYGARYSIKTALYIDEDNLKHCLERQIIEGLEPTIKSIWKSFCIFNKNFPFDDNEDQGYDDDAGDKSVAKLGRKIQFDEIVKKINKIVEERQGKEEDMEPMIRVDLLETFSQDVDMPLKSALVIRCGAKILVHGTLSCRSFALRQDQSLGDCVKMLKLDVIKSLLTRCELVCQDLLQGEEDQELRAVYETPVRAFARLPGTVIQFCDYLFQDESEQDSLNRFREVLGLDNLRMEHINLSVETIPNAKDLEHAETIINGKSSLFADLCRFPPPPKSWADSFLVTALRPFLSVPFSIIVATIASLTASYWYFSKSHEELVEGINSD